MNDMPNEITRFEIAKLELTPGDIVLIKTDMVLSREQAERLQKMVDDMVPRDVKVLVLSAGVTLEVLRDKRHS